MALYCRCCWNIRSLRGTGGCSIPQGTGNTLWFFSSKAKFQANCRSDDGADPSQEEAAESRKVCWAIGNKSCLRETLETPGKEERPFRGVPLCGPWRRGSDRKPGVPYKVGWKDIAHTCIHSDHMVTAKEQGRGGKAGCWEKPCVQINMLGCSKCCDREDWAHDGDPAA